MAFSNENTEHYLGGITSCFAVFIANKLMNIIYHKIFFNCLRYFHYIFINFTP